MKSGPQEYREEETVKTQINAICRKALMNAKELFCVAVT